MQSTSYRIDQSRKIYSLSIFSTYWFYFPAGTDHQFCLTQPSITFYTKMYMLKNFPADILYF